MTSGDLVSDLGNMSRVVTQLMLTMTDTMLLPHDVTESVNELYDLVTMDTLPSLPFEGDLSFHAKSNVFYLIMYYIDINPYSAAIDFRRQNPTPGNVTF